MRINRTLLLLASLLGGAPLFAQTAPAPVPAATPAQTPAPPVKAPSQKAAPSKAAPAADPGDDEEKAAKKAPRRFIPTDKGKADEDIPYPVDI
jgi:hypothetical protein